MVWVVDDIAEAALGPWGIALAVGVGIATAIRQRKAVAGSVSVPASLSMAGVSGGTIAVVDGVKDRVQTALAGAGEYWQDLYAEAHSEWEQGRAGTALAAGTARAAAVTTVSAPAAAGKRVRGPNGRFVKPTI